MAIGGNEEKRPVRASILAAFVRRSGAAEARIVIIPSASMKPAERAARYTRIFSKLGAGEIRTVDAHNGVSEQEREAIRNATGIFVTGGSQVRLMDALRATECVELIRDAVRDGAVYAGTSAGASALSRRMIAGSTRTKGTENVEFDEGLGLIPFAIVDQHFSERRRLSRLLTASNAHAMTGIGIDENTAIVWNHDGMVTVEGEGEVTVVQPDHRKDSHASSYRLQILQPGAKFVAD
ncbi:MAG TPA: cyanophycinase [Thermoanaerobaculia bacterium]|jgi:cyanophycinase